MIRPRLLSIASIALLAAGLPLLGHQAYLRTKGWVAERLLDRAFAAHLADGLPHRPWPWADLEPLARVEVPRLGIQRIVISGAAGSSMAFGLGHVSGTALPGRAGNCVLAGHRDHWASFLSELRPGDDVRIVTSGGTRVYRVQEARVVAREDLEVLEETGGSRLQLLTCYPFEGLLRSPWRYVVSCEPWI